MQAESISKQHREAVQHSIPKRTTPGLTNSRRMGLARRASSRRRGLATVWVAICLTTLLGMSALAIDMGFLYMRKAEAQKAADAAALAGALQLAQNMPQNANYEANRYAWYNGYRDPAYYAPGNNGATVTITYPVPGNPNWYRVTVRRPEQLFFATIFGLRNSRVVATSTALYTNLVDIPISPQFYGVNNGSVTYTMFGPYGMRSNGDNISVKYNNDRTTNNDYTGKGYDFTLNVPDKDTYKTKNGTTLVKVELYDPDCYNIGGQTNAGPTAVDEIRPGQPGGSSDYTTTQYSLYWDNNTPFNKTDDVLIKQRSFGNTSDSDLKWVSPQGFFFDRRDYPNGNFRINATTTDGSSENGFNMRAGPPDANDMTGNGNGKGKYKDTGDNYSEGGFVQANGTSIAAQGHLPMNFNIDGQADINLGYVPATAVNGRFTVNKFDTDVGARDLYYTCDTLPGQRFAANLNTTNDASSTDIITVPSGYSGGNWHAWYTAGSNDTSVWSVSYDNGKGNPGGVRLIQ